MEYEEGNICPYCNVDTVLYAGTARISDGLYNKGLAKIKMSDLSGAIEYLSKSISINKSNIQARNLLGLVLFETGRLGEAVKNWLISSSIQKEDNPARGYLDSVQKNARALERINDSVRIYNQALTDIKQKSDDMAIIKLKQVVDLNPKFIDALNLLTYCYMTHKDKDKAVATAERVFAIDANNAIALDYYSELNPSFRPGPAPQRSLFPRKRTAVGATPVDQMQSQQVGISPYKKVTLHERRSANFHWEGILCLVIGVICTLGVMYVLVFPALNRNRATQVEAAMAQLAVVEQTHDETLEERDQAISALEVRITNYEAREQELADELDRQARSLQILAASDLLRDGRLREAVDALGIIETDDLATDIAERAHEIRWVAYPQLAQQYFNEGFAAYSVRDFEKARVDFERAYRYAQHTEDRNLYGEIIYYLGWTFSQDQ
jgi:tetratricopeptide (TPR) repeat protein